MSLIAEIDARIEGRSLLDHPFYQKWVAGTLPKTCLQDYAKQYYAFESSFPRFLSAIHSRTEEPWARQAILENLWDEEHGEENHAELWLRFAEGVGVSRDEVRTAEPNAATERLLQTYDRTSGSGNVAAGVAAVYAYEQQVPRVAEKKIAGLRDHFGVDASDTLAFFRLHQGLDEEHAAAEAKIIEELGSEDREPVLASAQAALDAWWAFLDEVDSE
ncbi:MAG TPA: CADD family putative folate metabolism protein [Actinomycetota bacterium]|nr:CADD family putative folate metabolism protein [Actinomycetota bacterium]